MRILLDTCEFLWLVSGDAKLPRQLQQQFETRRTKFS